jgi:hypothetical protein
MGPLLRLLRLLDGLPLLFNLDNTNDNATNTQRGLQSESKVQEVMKKSIKQNIGLAVLPVTLYPPPLSEFAKKLTPQEDLKLLG